MTHKLIKVDNKLCTLNWDDESLYINCEDELIFILYQNQPSLRAVYNRLSGNLTGDYLERIGFQSA